MFHLSLKNKILAITIFTFLLTIVFYNIYLNSMKNDFIKSNIEEYNNNFFTSFENTKHNIHMTIKNRIKTVLEKESNDYFKQVLTNEISHEQAFNNINPFFKRIKNEMKYIYSLHIYNTNGISVIRLHNKSTYGDDLKSFRPAIKNIIENKKGQSFFENGLNGLLFRVVEPIYQDKTLLGYIEVGIKLKAFTNKIKQFYNMNSFLFIKNDLYYMTSNENKLKKEKIIFGDYRLFSRSNLSVDLLYKIPKSYKLQDDVKFSIEKQTLMVHTTDIKNIEGVVIGKILSFQDFTHIKKQQKDFLVNSVFISIVILIILILVLNRSYLVLTKELEKYLYILDKSKDSIFVIDINTQKLIFANENAKNILGYTKKELLNLKLEQFSIPMNIGEKLISVDDIESIKISQKSHTVRAYNREKSGILIPVQISFSYVKKDEEYLIAICHNISKQLNNEIKDKANAKMINQHIPISQTDLEGNITYVNNAFCKLVGYEQDELIGQNHRMMKHPDTKQSLYSNLWNKITNDESWYGVMRNIRKDDTTIWTEARIDPMYDYFNKKIGYIAARDDISDKKELEYMSDHDLLTKAKNRRSFEREIHKQIKKAHRFKEKESDFGLVMFDIDHFKNVNDIYGHHTGDMVLINLSEAIHLNIRESDTFARWGGEEFIILCPHSNIEDIKQFVEKLRIAMQKTNFLPVPSITASFGITIFDINDTIDSIQKRADDALYQAKDNGRDRYEVL